jgi:hypothetical protein
MTIRSSECHLAEAVETRANGGKHRERRGARRAERRFGLSVTSRDGKRRKTGQVEGYHLAPRPRPLGPPPATAPRLSLGVGASGKGPRELGPVGPEPAARARQADADASASRGGQRRRGIRRPGGQGPAAARRRARAPRGAAAPRGARAPRRGSAGTARPRAARRRPRPPSRAQELSSLPCVSPGPPPRRSIIPSGVVSMRLNEEVRSLTAGADAR